MRPAARPLPTGKLKVELLSELLAAVSRPDPSVLEGPGVGRDVALLDLGAPHYLAAKSDPITFATDAIGYYTVVINSNDLATCGARPRWMLATVLLPEGRTDEAMARDIFYQLRQACDRFDITLVGGHTEVTYGLDRPIVVGMMLGEVDRGLRLSPSQVRERDVVLMTKAVALEGTAILARERGAELARRGFEPAFIDRCARLLYEPGISVLAEAQAAVAAGGVHAMHDPTEGGLATGLWELALAAGKRIILEASPVPVLPECRRVCAAFGLDPLGLIASGTLLIVVEPAAAEAVAEAVRRVGVDCTPIATVAAGPPEVLVRQAEGTLRRLPRYDQDELTKVL
jgi:hydrogenase expression/formation protein HypE